MFPKQFKLSAAEANIGAGRRGAASTGKVGREEAGCFGDGRRREEQRGEGGGEERWCSVQRASYFLSNLGRCSRQQKHPH